LEQGAVKKILILGAGGMAGHVMAEYLAQKRIYEIIRCARSAVTPDTTVLDVTEFLKVEAVLHDRRPDIVVNCVGMLVQASQERVDEAILINSYLPHFLSGLGKKHGFKTIHISTDCVFSGDRGGYAEDDFRDGDTPYARTKALGEVINDADLTLRTSIIGPELKRDGTGLLHWFLMQKGEIKGFTKAYWSGVTTLELAKVVDRCIDRGVAGLVNLTMSRKISKFDLLVECQKVWNHVQVQVLPDEGHPCDKSLVSRRSDLQFQLPSSYSAMLNELRNFMKQHRDWYRDYPC
jgi:dTDP-4-dehydrorhamnose reductase